MAGTYAKYASLGPGGGGGGGGITSINGNTNAAQTIAGGTGISVASSGGTTTITNQGALDSFTIIQTPHGTSPTATTATSVLTLESTDSSITITGNSGTNTVNFQAAHTGTVTSVALAVPSIFTVSGSPVTTSGTLTLSYSGTALPIANGGTGLTSFTDYELLVGSSTGAITQVSGTGTSGYVLTSNGASALPTWQASSGGLPAYGATGNLLTSNGSSWISSPPNDTGLHTNTFNWQNTNYALTVSSLYQQVMVSGGGTDQLMSLPQATTLPLYWSVIIVDNGNNYNQIDVYAFDQTTLIGTVYPFSQITFECVDNTTSNGTWQTFSGIPTGASWGATSGINLGNGEEITGNGGGIGSTASIGFGEYFSITNGTGEDVLVVGAPIGDTRHWEINDNSGVECFTIDFREAYDSNGVEAISWDVGVRQLYDNNGNLQVDWGTNFSLYSPDTGSVAIQWNLSTLNDTSNNVVAGWGAFINVNYELTVNHLGGAAFGGFGGAEYPTVAPGTGAGTGGTTALSTIASDLAGTISINTGTSPSPNAVIATLTFITPYNDGPVNTVILSAANANGAGALSHVYWQPDASGNYFTINSTSTALTASTTYMFSYLVVQ